MYLDHIYVNMQFVLTIMITSRNKGVMGKVDYHNSARALKVESNFMWMEPKLMRFQFYNMLVKKEDDMMVSMQRKLG